MIKDMLRLQVQEEGHIILLYMLRKTVTLSCPHVAICFALMKLPLAKEKLLLCWKLILLAYYGSEAGPSQYTLALVNELTQVFVDVKACAGS